MKFTFVVFWACTAAAATLQGCSVAGPRESPLPRSGPKMIDIYERHVAENSIHGVAGESDPARRWYDEPGRPDNGGTASSGALNARFSRLPNPDLEMYVYPHLAKGRYPIPGYTTIFPMFESVQYALTGEVAPSAHRTMPPPVSGGPAVQSPASR